MASMNAPQPATYLAQTQPSTPQTSNLPGLLQGKTERRFAPGRLLRLSTFQLSRAAEGRGLEVEVAGSEDLDVRGWWGAGRRWGVTGLGQNGRPACAPCASA